MQMKGLVKFCCQVNIFGASQQNIRCIRVFTGLFVVRQPHRRHKLRLNVELFYEIQSKYVDNVV